MNQSSEIASVVYRLEARLRHPLSSDWAPRGRATTLSLAREAVDWLRTDEPQNEIRCIRVTEEVIEL